MKKIFLLLVLANLSYHSNGQPNPFMNDANGHPLFMRVEYTADGSPYLDERYQPADILTMEGKLYTNVKVKVDLASQLVQYLDDKGVEMISTTAIRKIRFNSMLADSRFEIILTGIRTGLNTTQDSIYQLLDSGRLSLLKHLYVRYKDERKYGEAGITRTFIRSDNYYVLYPGGKKVKLVRSRESVLDALADKRSQVEQFMSKEGLKARTDEDLQKIFRYYNSLF